MGTTAKDTCKHQSLTWRLLLSGKHLMPPSPDAWPSPNPPELSSWSPPACPVEGKRRTQGPYSINWDKSGHIVGIMSGLTVGDSWLHHQLVNPYSERSFFWNQGPGNHIIVFQILVRKCQLCMLILVDR